MSNDTFPVCFCTLHSRNSRWTTMFRSISCRSCLQRQQFVPTVSLFFDLSFSSVQTFNLCRNFKPHPDFCQEKHICFHSRFFMCPTLKNHPFQNQECSFSVDMAKDNWFHCLTRSDAKPTIFEKLLFQNTPKSPNLNDELQSNQTGFWCNTTDAQHFLAWDSDSDLNRIGGSGDLPFCLLQDNVTRISSLDLRRLLKNDISFEFHSKLEGKEFEW